MCDGIPAGRYNRDISCTDHPEYQLFPYQEKTPEGRKNLITDTSFIKRVLLNVAAKN